MWNQTRAFYGKPWLWCNIQTFGAAVDMHGPLNRINNRLERARTSAERGERIGLGFVNEGLEGNPLIYEFLTELAWHNRAVNLEHWLADYVLARYGLPDENLNKAWTCLLESVYSDWPRSGTFQSVNRFPRLNLPDGPPFNTGKVALAWQLLLHSGEELKNTDTYAYDLVMTGIQVLADYSYQVQKEMLAAFRQKDLQKFNRSSRLFLDLFTDLEQLAATHRQFLLGRWLADARRWGDTVQEKNRMEWNARRILTVWGSGNNIRDYSRRNWAGMFSTFYRPRWVKFIKAMEQALRSGSAFDEAETNQTLLEWERAWTEKNEVLPVEPQGDYLAVSQMLWNKYGAQLLSGKW
jgi:alpha-N-acetylglucosaminidase